jgi:hypothetical protein
LLENDSEGHHAFHRCSKRSVGCATMRELRSTHEGCYEFCETS